MSNIDIEAAIRNILRPLVKEIVKETIGLIKNPEGKKEPAPYVLPRRDFYGRKVVDWTRIISEDKLEEALFSLLKKAESKTVNIQKTGDFIALGPDFNGAYQKASDYYKDKGKWKGVVERYLENKKA